MTKYQRATIVNSLNMLNMILVEKDSTITEIVYTIVDNGKSVKWFMPVCDSTGKNSDADLMHNLKVYTDKLIQYEANKYLEVK